MNAEYVQHLRYKLQRRARRLNSTGFRMFHFALKQFWGFINDCSVLLGILEDIEHRFQRFAQQADDIVTKHTPLVFESEIENAATAYFVIKKCVGYQGNVPARIEIQIGMEYTHETGYEEILEQFKTIFIEPFCEYLDEQLDDQRAILALLGRYKHKCEWFRRNQLYQRWKDNSERGEKQLALHLYEYLHDQGIDFFIEPSALSVRGEPDLVAAQSKEDPLIADAKIFNPEMGKGKEYIASGFNQIYKYTVSYNEPFGYLIIFKTSGTDLRFLLSTQSQSTPFVVHNNKTIFLVTIDISPLETPASRAGPITPIEITEADLIRVVSETKKE